MIVCQTGASVGRVPIINQESALLVECIIVFDAESSFGYWILDASIVGG